MQNKVFIIANWKMNPEYLSGAKDIFLGIKKTASTLRNVQTVICPPFVYLSELSKLYKGHRVLLGGQNLYFGERGSHTGEISAPMLKSVGASFVIIGHSERRVLGEENSTINKKVISALKTGLSVVLCIGESEHDQNGKYLAFLEEELKSALVDVPKTLLRNLLIAYEPIWAIGRSVEEAMKPEDVYETVLFLRKLLVEQYDKKSAFSIPILYGGSAEAGNTKTLLTEGGVNGLLVGHASLSTSEFSEILKIANTVS
jgi:triosephosphate isomerase (TIM)